MKRVYLSLLMILLLAGCSADKAKNQSRVVDAKTQRDLALGQVFGFVTERGAHAWLGLPFAQPPVGDLRWRAPVAVLPWSEAKEATQFA